MNVRILDHYGARRYVTWSSNEFGSYTHTHEMPGGMTSCSFFVPGEYKKPFVWADPLNQVDVYHNFTQVFSGFIYGVERLWGTEESGIRVDCSGWVGKLAQFAISTNLSNEKASTYITDHIVGDSEIDDWITDSSIDTTDYTIPGVREYKPHKTARYVMDDLYSFNQNTHDWYVWGKTLYWDVKESDVDYVTSTKYSVGSLRQDLSEFSNEVVYSYRDADGEIQTGTSSDSDTSYPNLERIESYSNNMTSAQATQLADESLEQRKVLGATAQITLSRVWRAMGGELHPSEIRPGKIIRINGLVAAKATPTEIFMENDINVFSIKSVTYDDNNQKATISPGRLPHTLPIVMTRFSK